MNATQQGILILLKSAITGEALPLPADVDWETAQKIIKCHQIGPLVYAGAVNCGVDKNLPWMQKLFQTYCKNMMVSEMQLQSVKKLCDAFEEAGIDYMPVKGCNMKPRYPKPELRAMGDADILIKLDQYDRIVPILEAQHYKEVLESDHELIWNGGILHLELHKRLMPSYNKDYFRYFGDGWRLAKEQNGCHWAMTAEDEYIYLFTHFAKHYRDGGIGLRHVLDLWVFERSVPTLDESYVCRELDKLRLLEFRENISKLLRVWFEEEETDEKTEFISQFVFGSGSFGSKENKSAADGARDAETAGSARKGMAMRLRKILFPPLENMQLIYPALKKLPVLLPVFWAVRWVRTILFRRDRISVQRIKLQQRSVEEIETYQQALDFVGLDFQFKE